MDGVFTIGGDVNPPRGPVEEGEAGNPLGDKPPIPPIVIIPMRELTEGRRGCNVGGRGGDRGKEEEGEGEMRGEGRKKAPPSACCCCRGAWTSGPQMSGRGRGDTVPLPPMTPPLPAMASCMANMLSCLTICCTSMLSQEPRVPAPGPPGPRPPPRPILAPREPPCDDFRRSMEFFRPVEENIHIKCELSSRTQR